MNLEIIKELYGDEVLKMMLENIDIIEKNVKTLQELGFNESEEFLTRYPSIFMNFPKQFTNKINKLKDRLGNNFVEIIENDISILEELDVLDKKGD